jgi:hypothetical protein
MKFRFYNAILVVMAMLALPAVAQFEPSPDHFDDNPPENARISQRVTIQQQLSTHQATLRDCRKRIKFQAALLEQARQKVKSLGDPIEKEAAEVAVQARQKDLEALQRSLAEPIRLAKVAIASLKTERRYVATASLRPVMPRPAPGLGPQQL